MSWAAQVTTKQEICFLVYIYISTILLLEEYTRSRLPICAKTSVRLGLGSARLGESRPVLRGEDHLAPGCLIMRVVK